MASSKAEEARTLLRAVMADEEELLAKVRMHFSIVGLQWCTCVGDEVSYMFACITGSGSMCLLGLYTKYTNSSACWWIG